MWEVSRCGGVVGCCGSQSRVCASHFGLHQQEASERTPPNRIATVVDRMLGGHGTQNTLDDGNGKVEEGSAYLAIRLVPSR